MARSRCFEIGNRGLGNRQSAKYRARASEYARALYVIVIKYTRAVHYERTSLASVKFVSRMEHQS